LGRVAWQRGDELAHLQDQVPPFPFEKVKETIENQLKSTIDELFEEFGTEPIAAAS